jgi:hypothetical protein
MTSLFETFVIYALLVGKLIWLPLARFCNLSLSLLQNLEQGVSGISLYKGTCLIVYACFPPLFPEVSFSSLPLSFHVKPYFVLNQNTPFLAPC